MWAWVGGYEWLTMLCWFLMVFLFWGLYEALVRIDAIGVNSDHS